MNAGQTWAKEDSEHAPSRLQLLEAATSGQHNRLLLTIATTSGIRMQKARASRQLDDLIGIHYLRRYFL